MTIGDLSRRTGVTARALRRYEGMGLVYTAGRSAANYRLFDESALWCVQVIQSLRSLGLSVSEIRELAGVYLGRPDQPVGPRLAERLRAVRARIERRMSPFRATGPVGIAANCAVGVAVYLAGWLVPPIRFASDAVLAFYGASMLLAALRGYAGCEVLAVSNWLLRRDDQVGCVVLTPLDALERDASTTG